MSNIFNKIILGSAQLGLDYGINNAKGKVSSQEVAPILRLSHDYGVSGLDTSYAYGDSELVIRDGLRDTQLDFKIISKYPRNTGRVEDVLQKSIQRLGVSHLYGYLIHHFEFFKEQPSIWEDFKRMKEKGVVEKIGYSIYSIQELDYLLSKNISFDLIQFPFNILDRQFSPYLVDLKNNNVEIHVRSVFLQGLFFKDLSKMEGVFYPLKKYLKKLHCYCKENHLSVEQITLNYVLSDPNIDGVLIGVDNLSQLKKNFDVVQKGIDKESKDFIDSIFVKEKELLNPVNWKI